MLRWWRSLVVVVTLVAGATLAYMPGYPGYVSAETFSTPTPDASVEPPPVTEPTPIDAPTPEPATASPDQPTTPPDATPGPSDSPTPDATDPVPPPTPDGSPLASSEPAQSPSPVPSVAPSGLDLATLTLTVDRESAEDGIVRVEPLGSLTVTATITAASALDGVSLVAGVPISWKVGDASGAVRDEAAGTVSWAFVAVGAGESIARSFTLSAPAQSEGPDSPPSTISLNATMAGAVVVGPTISVVVAPPITITHVTLGRVPGAAQNANYLTVDQPLFDQPRFEVFRVRFEIVNNGSADLDLTPTLEWASAPDGTWAALPAAAPLPGSPFYAAPEWIREPDGGTQIGPPTAYEGGPPAVTRSMGVNPLPPLILVAGETHLVEFSVAATVEADYLSDYWLRLSDAGTHIADAALAQVRTSDRPDVSLSPGQRNGVPADVSSSRTVTLGPFTFGSTSGFHAPAYSLTSDACGACHRAHTAQGTSVTAAESTEALCYSCHDGSNAPDVRSVYAGVPANDAASRAYYQHDPTGADLAYNSRPECTACHNPHDSDATVGASGASGWTPPGALAGAPAVAVNYSAGISYSLVNRPTLEYQLCLKCHSGYATLPSNAGQPFSRYTLDKGVEVNPSNGSYHPVSAPGRNQSPAMEASLAGSSPYKLWTFAATDTVRCLSCHADARLVNQAGSAGLPLTADSSLSIHASPERGLLIASYRDRVLKGSLDGYAATDFALCFVCHAEAPFRDASGDVRSDTNFRYHGLHVSGATLVDHGSDGTDIDRPGDGGGLAVCAECHFRIHSSGFPVFGQSNGPRLVDFAPNVSGGTTPADWTVKTDSADGTCTLKCHGQPHRYQY